jgi:hypothetical protein
LQGRNVTRFGCSLLHLLLPFRSTRDGQYAVDAFVDEAFTRFLNIPTQLDETSGATFHTLHEDMAPHLPTLIFYNQKIFMGAKTP